MALSLTLQQLLEEGRDALQKGDRALALSSFTLATQLHPEDESAWLLRSQAASDPTEAAQCLEQVLKINPNNAQAKQTLLPSQLGSLQQEARRLTDAKPKKWHMGPVTVPAPGKTFRSVVLFVLFVGIVAAGAWAAYMAVPGLLAKLAANSNGSAARPPVALAILEMPPTWTPAPTRTAIPIILPTPTPEWKTVRAVSIRSGPGPNYSLLAAFPEGTTVFATGRTDDGKYLQVDYASGKLGWVAAADVSVSAVDLVGVPVVSTATVVATSAPRPTVRPTSRPVVVPTVRMDYVLGRPVQTIADCSKGWKVVGTVYDSRSNGRRVNGIPIRIWVGNQAMGTMQSGGYRYDMTGYWEWSFSPYSDVTGQIAVVGSDGSLRSQPVGFHLTSQCDGQGAANQIIIDMAGNQ